MSPIESDVLRWSRPRLGYTILIDAKATRDRLEGEGVTAGQLSRRLNCEPNWPAIEIEIALCLLAEARRAQQ